MKLWCDLKPTLIFRLSECALFTFDVSRIRICVVCGSLLNVQALQTFLDESCNGYVSKEDWMKQLVEQYQGKTFKHNI